MRAETSVNAAPGLASAAKIEGPAEGGITHIAAQRRR
jgi:hypothetical protein